MFQDFIGVFDQVLSVTECKEIIEYYENLRSLDLIYTRQDLKDGLAHYKNDETAFLLQHDTINTFKHNPILQSFVKEFWKCYQSYVNEYSLLYESGLHGMHSIRLQKTRTGQGFHMWHYESSELSTSNRVIAWSLYLNTVKEGGETEFLYYKKRINPIEGRLVIWPAGFTHTHRGNTPLSNDKYIITGWLEFMGGTNDKKNF